ncbi:MAG: hypothetical protein Kow00121_32160 [Elainellaceae cyanobacterium]
MNEKSDKIQFKFPLWPYLMQPLFSPEFKSLNPFRFWYLYNLEQLEAAWMNSSGSEVKDVTAFINFLETCWNQTCWRSEPHFNTEFRSDAEFISFLERCWIRNLSKSKNYLDYPDQ